MPIEKSQNDSFTNKQTIIFKFLFSKSFLLLWMFMDGNMKKNHYSKHCKNSISSFSLKSWFFRHEILQRPLIGQIWPLGHLGWLMWLEMSKIFDISLKKLRSEKVYHKCVKQPGHLVKKSTFQEYLKKIIDSKPQYFGTCGRNRRRIMKISGKIKKRRLSNLMKIRNKNYSKFVIK